MDLNIKTVSNVEADVESEVSIVVEQSINSDTTSLHSKESNTSNDQLLTPVFDVDSSKEFKVSSEHTVQAQVVDLEMECFDYNILDRWQEYTYDMSNNVHVFNIELPSR